jgi:hypothetical protein
VTASTVANFEYFVKSGTTTKGVTEFTEDSLYCLQSDITYSMAVKIVSSNTYDTSVTSFITFDSDPTSLTFMDVNINTNDETLVGDYDVEITGAISAPLASGTLTATLVFRVTVKKCSDTTGSIFLSDPDLLAPADLQYVICSGQLDIQASLAAYLATSTTQCAQENIEYSYLITPQNPSQTVTFISNWDNDPSVRTLSVDTCDGSQIGFYDVTISAKVTAPLAATNDGLDQSFTIEIATNNADIVTPDIYEVKTYQYATAGDSKTFDQFLITTPGYTDATWVYTIRFEKSSASFDTSFITLERKDASKELKVSWVTDYIDQETTVSVFVKGVVTASWGDTYWREVQFDLKLELPDCAETSEEITLAIGSTIADQFYFFGDGELLIQVSDFTESSSKSCGPDDIVYSHAVTPDTSGQATSFIAFDDESL